MEPIKLDDVTVQFGDRTILNNLSVSFSLNKVTAIIGKSGSGKSTLLKTINGLQKPTHGKVSVFGSQIDYGNLQSLRKQIGYVIQGIGLFPHLSVEDNILLMGKTHLSEKKTMTHRLHELMRLVNLPERLLKKFPHELSGGEQQRAGICRALFLEPLIMLFDEPFGSLDPITRYDIHQEFIQLQRTSPRSVLLVTHDMREAKRLADEILVIDNGIIQQFGSTQSIFDCPATDVVKELIMVAEV